MVFPRLVATGRRGSAGGSDHVVELGLEIESPPCVLYGPPTESAGALLSGLVTVHVQGAGAEAGGCVVARLTLVLEQQVTYGRPFVAGPLGSCAACRERRRELARWEVVAQAAELAGGRHAYPFSHLLAGELPATSTLGSAGATQIRYELVADAVYRAGGGEERRRELRLPVLVTRSILRGPDRNSLRVFPPTDVTATAVLPSVIYPRSTIPLELQLGGVCCADRRWRMRRLTWRIDEKVRVRSHACAAHRARLRALEEEVRAKTARNLKKPAKPIKRTPDMGPQVTVSVATVEDPLPFDAGSAAARQEADVGNMDDDADTQSAFIHPSDHAMQQELQELQARIRQQQLEEERKQETSHYIEEVRTIAGTDIRSGWKSDFSGSGKIELVMEIDCMKLNSGVTNPVNMVSTTSPYLARGQAPVNVTCDVEDPTLGISVNHLLLVEIIVAEEMLHYTNGQLLSKGEAQGEGEGQGEALAEAKPAGLAGSHADQRLAELSPMFANRNNSMFRASAEEHSPGLEPDGSTAGADKRIVGTPTGAARVLRMQFKLTMTERSGLGISWDDEVPPKYQQVKFLYPPSYDEAVSASVSEVSGSSRVVSGPESNPAVRAPVAASPTQPPAVREGPSSLGTSGSAARDMMFISESSTLCIGGESPSALPAVEDASLGHRVCVRKVSELLDTDRITQ
ncbi:ACR291Cp [Eremothecium gossypii ATCC 10895]|uniref:Protein LDB19 n=1 Tax=Eremothecium gossypii (strain ATCC 10895 / CBS 109.51 / FGSC 9923 / NRRL Y-1056) TaxID=284811 RepID=LDB19_EREGS|nr:ACR291Cp [Eremothecium gossypii ATCC 10895]Q75BI0.1 RecName: Full=Protein LDB19 [Eremothecium gossypii ATCC 10895]AAS51517.1 ACR291Cp [Eremothecium gossypii ATCC 10895]AEY95809.1 FACR291Cp [Eremothecium gossypii FDAG1]